MDQSVPRLLEERLEVVTSCLAGQREKLDRLAETLLHEEAVGQEALVRSLGPRPAAPLETPVRA